MRTAALAAWLLAATAGSARAQIVPNIGNARAEYFGLVATAADRMARGLEQAVASGDSVQLARRFGPDLVWTPSAGAPVRGPAAAAAALRRARPRLQNFRIELAELDASDRLAFVTGRFRYEVPTASGLVSSSSVPFAAALYREREDDWRIHLLSGGDLPPLLQVRGAPAAAAEVGTAIPLEVELRDGAGAPLPRSVIRIDVEQGGGRVSPSDLVTDDDGRAATTFTLGPKAGPQAVRVLSGALPDEPLFVRVTGRVASPATIALSADTTRRVTAGDAWPSPVQLRALDTFGNGVPGVEVAVTASGAGSLNVATVRTDSTGTASVALQTSATPGEILIEARSGAGGGELALRTRPGLAARIDLPTQGVELVERSNRETGARALDAAGRPTDEPALRFLVRREQVALVTDDARVVALAPGQTWLVARAGDVVDSLWVTVRAADGSALRSSARVITGAADSLVTLDIALMLPSDSLQIASLAGTVFVEGGAATIVRAEPLSPAPSLKFTPGLDGQSLSIAYVAPAAARRPAAPAVAEVGLVRLSLKLGPAGSRGGVRTSISRIVGPPRGAAVPLPPSHLVPVTVSGTRPAPGPIPLP